jgi:hypothetical protein
MLRCHGHFYINLACPRQAVGMAPVVVTLRSLAQQKARPPSLQQLQATDDLAWAELVNY